MNSEQLTQVNNCEKRMAPLKAQAAELASFGGNSPDNIFAEYAKMKAEAFVLDAKIRDMLPPKKGEEKAVTQAMTNLEMVVNSMCTIVEVLETAVKDARLDFLKNQSKEIASNTSILESQADKQIVDLMCDLAKALKIHWQLTEKSFLLGRYISVLRYELDNPMGMGLYAESKIQLGFEGINPVEREFNRAYLTQYMKKIGSFDPNNFTVEEFKKR